MYVKTKLNDQVEIKVELYEDEIFSDCTVCGRPIEITPEDIKEIWEAGSDFASTTFRCKDCK